MTQERTYRKLQNVLVNHFLLVAAIPLLLLSVIHGRAYTQKLRTEASFRLQEAVIAIRQNVVDYVDSHRRAIVSLADRLAELPLDNKDVMPVLRDERSLYDGFFSLVLIAPSGEVIAWFPDGPRPNLSVSFPVGAAKETVGAVYDRPYS